MRGHFLVGFRICMHNPTRPGWESSDHIRQEREFFVGYIIAILTLGKREVYGASIYPGRGAGFHPVRNETETAQLLSYALRGVFGNTPTGDFHRSEMHQTVEKSTRSENNLIGHKFEAKACADTTYGTFF